MRMRAATRLQVLDLNNVGLPEHIFFPFDVIFIFLLSKSISMLDIHRKTSHLLLDPAVRNYIPIEGSPTVSE
jgi:hypothetical protein